MTITQLKHSLALAWPIMLANLATPLLGMVDNSVLGHTGQTLYLSAMGISVSLFTYILWGFNFLSISCCSFTAKAQQTQNNIKVPVILLQYLCIACVLAIVVASLCYVSLNWIIAIAVDDVVIQHYVQQYLQIRLLAIPAIFCLQVLIAWFAGLQSPKIALYVLIISFSINAILDVVFVSLLQFGMQGVAIASVIAEYTALLVVLILAIRRCTNNTLVFAWQAIQPHLIAFKQLFSISIDLFSRSWVLLAVFVLFNYQSLQHGNDVAAANTILLLLIILSSSLLDGFADSAQIQIAGHHRRSQFIAIIKTTGVLSVACAAVLSAVYFLAMPNFLYAISDDAATRSLANEFRIWLVLLPLTSVASYWLDGVFAGLNASKTMRNTVFVNFFLLYLPCLFWLAPVNNHFLWLSLHIFMLSRSIYMLLALRHQLRRMPS